MLAKRRNFYFKEFWFAIENFNDNPAIIVLQTWKSTIFLFPIP